MLDIYVGNLPDRANVAALRELFDDVVRHKPRGSFLGSFLSRYLPSYLSSYRNSPVDAPLQFTMVNPVQGRRARYCRISGNSQSSASKIIEQLSGAGLYGQVLEVRPFYPRVMTNDRRRAGWHFRRWLGVERRMSERRDES